MKSDNVILVLYNFYDIMQCPFSHILGGKQWVSRSESPPTTSTFGKNKNLKMLIQKIISVENSKKGLRQLYCCNTFLQIKNGLILDPLTITRVGKPH